MVDEVEGIFRGEFGLREPLLEAFESLLDPVEFLGLHCVSTAVHDAEESLVVDDPIFIPVHIVEHILLLIFRKHDNIPNILVPPLMRDESATHLIQFSEKVINADFFLDPFLSQFVEQLFDLSVG